MPTRRDLNCSSRSKRGNTTKPVPEALGLREIYMRSCSKLNVRPNSEILRILPDEVGAAFPYSTLDLRDNYLGNNGMIALMVVVENIAHLKELLVSHNGLRNSAVQAIGAVASRHPSLVCIDISDNYISEGAAASLESMLRVNPRITRVVFDNTKIGVEQRVRINDLLQVNHEHCAIAASLENECA